MGRRGTFKALTTAIPSSSTFSREARIFKHSFPNLKTFFLTVCRTKSTFLLAVSASVSSGSYRHQDIGESVLSFHLPDSVLGAWHPSVKKADKYPIELSFWGRQTIKPERVRSSVSNFWWELAKKKKKKKEKTSRAWIVPYSSPWIVPYLGYSMAPHSSTLAWKIPWMEKPGKLQSMGSLGVRHDWSNLAT